MVHLQLLCLQKQRVYIHTYIYRGLHKRDTQKWMVYNGKSEQKRVMFGYLHGLQASLQSHRGVFSNKAISNILIFPIQCRCFEVSIFYLLQDDVFMQIYIYYILLNVCFEYTTLYICGSFIGLCFEPWLKIIICTKWDDILADESTLHVKMVVLFRNLWD